MLSRRVTRSLRAFLEEASDVMQFHVRKLYTVEGRKIDNVQSLMTCPNVLVCVGREAFSPLLVNYIRKGSEEKLPGLGTRTPGNGARSPPHGAQSRASENSEGPDSKKNTVNFGLETKKSIIHPRSDSSTRSARFSMSSEKSNGLSTVSQGQAAILNDDIEKRVVVNKDGSLSVEMRVRFRLHSDETLQWSTRIKKSPSLTNDSCSASQGQPHYLQHESCSDADCPSFEAETADYPTQCPMDTNRCPCCYRQDQQFDLWENPMHNHKQPVPPPHSTTEDHTILRHTHSSSSSSSCNSTRVVRCRARLTNCKDGLEHSQIVREEMSITEQHVVEQEVCTVSRSCSSEVVINSDELRPHSYKSGEEDVERPMSAISASSHILQDLKDDDEEDLPPSVSRCIRELSPTSEIQIDGSPPVQNNCEEEEEATSCHCHSTSGAETNERAASSKSKAGSFKETTDDGEEATRIVSGLSACSRQSATSLCTNCGGWKVKVASEFSSRASIVSNSKSPKPTTTNSGNSDKDESGSDVSKLSNMSNLTSHREEGTAEEVRVSSAASSHRSNTSCKSRGKDDKREENRSPSVISAKSDNSNCSAVPNLTNTEEAEEENLSKRAGSGMSTKSGTSAKTSGSRKSTIKVTPPSTAEDEEESKEPTAESEKSNTSTKENRPTSAKSQEETRGASVLSIESNVSAKIKTSLAESTALQNERTQIENAEEEPRVASVLSVKSNKSRSASPRSIKSDMSSENKIENLEVKSNGKESRPGSASSNKSIKSDVSKASDKTKGVRPLSVVSVKSNATGKSLKSAQGKIKAMGHNNEDVEVQSNSSAKKSRPASEMSKKSANSEQLLKDDDEVQNDDEETRATSWISEKSTPGRPASAVSGKSSKVSEKSHKSKDEEETRAVSAVSSSSKASNKTEQNSLSPKSNVEQDGEERAGSTMSDKSRKSNKLICDGAVQNGEEHHSERSSSAVSSKSVSPVKSSRSASPVKEKEEVKALSPSSAKTHSSTISAKSKKSNKTVISEHEHNGKGERATSPLSVKSGTSRTFHVIAVKTPEVVNVSRPMSSASSDKSNVSNSSKGNTVVKGEKKEGNESLVEDQDSKGEISNTTYELMAETGEQRGSSSLSVRSCKSAKSSRSKCKCGKKEGKIQAEESEVVADMSSPKREDFEDDSFASVSLVLPEDNESESGESNVSLCRNKTRSVSPEVSKTVENLEDEQAAQNNPNTNDIPTIETPGDTGKDHADQKTRVSSSCSIKSVHSVKSTKSSKSCSNCGKLKTEERPNGAGSPVASVKSIATTRTGQLTAPDNRTASAMSSSSVRSQRKIAKSEVDNSSEKSGEHDSKIMEEIKIITAKPKSPCQLRPKSSGSNKSKTNSNKALDDCASVQSVKSSHSKEGNAVSQNQKNLSRPASKGDTGSESILSHSLSAADLAREANAKPADSPRSKCSKSSIKSTKSQRSKKEATLELTPSCLPNASPNEVVSDWLKTIPANVLALGDEEGLPHKSADAMDGENGDGDKDENKGEAEVRTEESEREKEEAKEEGRVEKFEIRPNGMATGSSLPKNVHPSAAVMKVLLSSSLGRCRSMPEVSPVYGRRLSTSAKELLDCLTQLQLIEPAGHQGYSVQKDQHPQFDDVISILQSLWLNEARDIAVDPKDPSGVDQVSPPRSSSGVGMSSGSGGSGKDNGNQEDEAKPEAETEVNTEEVSENPDSPKVSDNPSSSLDKNSKSPSDNELDTHEGSSSDNPTTEPRAPLTKHQSQDPNPVWVLHLLKKLEKQFINHYVSAMADFKVKWDLEDNLILDRMIVDLKDEVSQRIERSVEREMKKIQSRAGKGVRVPRPPRGHNLSQDSAMTDKRRQRLMVMKKQSVKTGDSVSDGELTGDNSDQRSDDEYCPCETCIRKKMAARPLKTNPNAIVAPVQTEFDLLKILQLKKTPTPVVAKPEIVQEEVKRVVEEDCRNLEVVQEEEEDEESKTSDSSQGAEEDVCQCHSSEDDSNEQTEESDKETVREKSLQKETAEEEEGGDEDTTEGGASEEESRMERASEQEGVPAVNVTEGEDADVEDSGTEEKSEDDPIHTEIPTSKPKEDMLLLQQCTRTSVESQPGSLDDTDGPPVANSKEVRKLASPGGTIHKRSRSPARVKRRKVKNSDSDMENI